MASNTLSQLTYWTAAALGITIEGTVVSGTTVTMVDATGLTQDADYWLNGSIWITYDAGGAGAAPQWENSVISDFGGGTVTFSPAISAAPAVGDRYAVAKRRYPYGILKQKVNQALRELGSIEVTSTSAVTISSAQTEYSLPDVANLDLREIWIQGRTDDANDNEWRRLDGSYIQKSATGTANLLMLPMQYSTDYVLKLVYAGQHADLNLGTDEVDDSINRNLIIYGAAIGCLLYRKQKVGDDDGEIAQQLNYYTNLFEEAKMKYPIHIPTKKPKLLIPLGKYEEDRFKTVDDLGNA